MEKIAGLRFNPTDFEIVHMSVSLRGLAKVFDEFRIVHINDLHLGQWMSPERLEGVVGLVKVQSPDIVAITGVKVKVC
jgi:hypothetical protein